MTSFFAYDTLTWPEVAALRRDTPLVIPLGEGYDRARLAETLGDPPRVGLLPPIPYGWPGSGLTTAPEPFARSEKCVEGLEAAERAQRIHGRNARRSAAENLMSIPHPRHERKKADLNGEPHIFRPHSHPLPRLRTVAHL